MKRYHVNPDEADPAGTNSTGNEPSATSTELLRQAQADDPSAWEQLVNHYSRRMYRWCRRAGLQPADAGNVVQESLQAVARNLGSFRRDRPGDTFRGWLRRITDNKIRDHYRQRGRAIDIATGGTDGHERLANLPQINLEDQATWDTSIVSAISPQQQTASSPISSPQNSEFHDQIGQIRSEVSERDWKFFWRVVVDGQSAADVGREFGVTANTVRLVKMRLLRKLRRKLGTQQTTHEP